MKQRVKVESTMGALGAFILLQVWGLWLFGTFASMVQIMMSSGRKAASQSFVPMAFAGLFLITFVYAQSVYLDGIKNYLKNRNNTVKWKAELLEWRGKLRLTLATGLACTYVAMFIDLIRPGSRAVPLVAILAYQALHPLASVFFGGLLRQPEESDEMLATPSAQIPWLSRIVVSTVVGAFFVWIAYFIRQQATPDQKLPVETVSVLFQLMGSAMIALGGFLNFFFEDGKTPKQRPPPIEGRVGTSLPMNEPLPSEVEKDDTLLSDQSKRFTTKELWTTIGVILAMFFGGAALFAWCARDFAHGISETREGIASKHWPVVEAKVIDTTILDYPRGRSKQQDYRPKIAYEYAVGGVRYETNSWYYFGGLSPIQYAEVEKWVAQNATNGSTIQVAYDPNQPFVSKIQTGVLGHMIATLVGEAILSIVGFILWGLALYIGCGMYRMRNSILPRKQIAS